MAPAQFEVAAAAIGVEPTVVREKFRGGMSLAEMAGESGTALDAMVGAIHTSMEARLRAQVAVGALPEEDAVRATSMLDQWIPNMVRVHQQDLAR